MMFWLDAMTVVGSLGLALAGWLSREEAEKAAEGLLAEGAATVSVTREAVGSWTECVGRGGRGGGGAGGNLFEGFPQTAIDAKK